MIRFFDIIFSLIALILLSPVLLIICLLLKFTGEGEIFYLQSRVGKGKQNFSLFKFATMLKDSENIGSGTVTIHNDPRILPMGRFLRNSKLNELPQLINILNGGKIWENTVNCGRMRQIAENCGKLVHI